MTTKIIFLREGVPWDILALDGGHHLSPLPVIVGLGEMPEFLIGERLNGSIWPFCLRALTKCGQKALANKQNSLQSLQTMEMEG